MAPFFRGETSGFEIRSCDFLAFHRHAAGLPLGARGGADGSPVHFGRGTGPAGPQGSQGTVGPQGNNPLGVSGPYESLNVGLNSTPPVAVGTDLNPNAVYWSTMTPSNYADGGISGVGVFRPDTNWAPYTPAVKFTTVN